MSVCGSVNWCRIGRLVVIVNLLLCSVIAQAQNLPPVVNRGIPNQHAVAGSSFSYTFPGTAFKDANGDNLTYTVTSSPAGASISGRKITVTPGAEGLITVTVIASDGFLSASTTFTIEVHAAGTSYAAFTMDVNTGCDFLSVQFINQSSINATQYSWDWDLDNGNHSNLPNPSAIYTKPGSYDVTLTVTDNTGQTYTYSDGVTVNESPKPSIDESNIKDDCEPYDVTLTSNGDAGIYYHWYCEEFPAPINRYTTDGSISLSKLKNNTYNVALEVTDANGCSGTTNYQPLFVVNDQPKASFTYHKDDGCKASSTTFTNTSTIEGSTITGHLWTIDGVQVGTDQNLTNNFPKAGRYAVSLTETSANGCVSNTYTDTVKFNENNSASFKFSPEQVCKGTPVNFTPKNVSPGVSGYSWNFEGTTVSGANQTWNFNNAGDNKVILKTSFNDGCVITADKTVPIDSIVADFSYSVTGACLDNFTLSLSDQSASMIGAAITSVKWLKDRGDGTFQQIYPPLTGQKAGIYRIKLEVTDATGCSSWVTKDITITNSSLSFSIDGATSGCAGAEANNFSPNFQSNYDSITHYSWDFGDGNTSTEANPTHTFGNGNFNVSLNVTTKNGCPYSYMKNNAVQFADPPVIDSIQMIQNNYCMNSGVTFNTYYTPGTDQVQYTTTEIPVTPEEVEVDGTSYTYNHPFNNFGTFKLTAIAIDNGCPSAPVSVNNIRIDGPKASFSTANSFCNVKDVHFSNETTPAVATNRIYLWNFGDGNSSTETSPNHTYSDAGNYTVSLTATDTVSGCSDNYTQPIQIFTFDNTASDIISVSDNSDCAPLENVLFTANVKASDNFNNYALVWNFGDGTPDTTTNFPSVNHTFEKPGIYHPILHITGNGCDFSASSDPVTAQGTNVDFSISTPVCMDSPVNFTNKSVPTVGGTASGFEWNFDGVILNAPSPGDATYTYISEGTKTVSLKITDSNGCSGTLSKTVTIEPFSAGFTASSTTVCEGNAVTFTNTSEGDNLTYHWDFDGDGTDDMVTSSNEEVSHIYNTPNDYTATLRVTTANGCTKTDKQTIHVVHASADFTAAATEIGCAPADASFTPEADDADVESYWWDFGDGITWEGREATHRYYTPGTYTVSLTITFKAGCNTTATKVITVDGAKGVLNYSGAPSCAPNEVEFTLTDMWSVNSILWDFGNGITKTDSVPDNTETYSTTYTYTGTGFTKPSVILTSNSSKCSKSFAYEKNSSGDNDPVNIYTSTPPVAAFITNYNDICQGIPIQFTDKSTQTDSVYPAQKWYWDFDDADGATDTLHQNPTHAYNQVGSVIPQLVIYNALGCSDTVTGNLKIEDITHVTATIENPSSDNALICPEINTDFSGSANSLNGPITGWKWNFGDGGNAAGQSATHSFEKTHRGETLEILLVATDDKLCSDTAYRTVAINSLKADFGYSPQPAYRGGSVDFFDQSATSPGDPVTSWRWSFENGSPPSVYNIQNPKNISYEDINRDGNAVMLEIESDMGCTDDVTVLLPVLNNPPELESFNIKTLIDTRHYFKVDDFKDLFTDKDAIVGQEMQGIQIISLPSNGDLYLGNSKISGITTIDRSDIGNLYYISSIEGPDAFDWNATDGTDYANSAATVNIQVDPIPPAPTLSDLVFNIREDSVLTFSLTTFEDYFSNELMFDGFGLDTLRVVTIPTSAQGILTYNSNPVSAGEEFSEGQIEDGSFTVTPVTGYDGSIVFYWNGFDSLKWGETPGKVIINYLNEAPVLSDIERGPLKQDEVQTISQKDFLDHYYDSDKNDSPDKFYLEIPSGLDGTFKINGTVAATGTNTLSYGDLVSVTFTPTTGYEGEIDVVWGISDGQDEGTAHIIFNFVNAPPVANDFSVTGDEDKAIKFLTTDFSNRPPFEDADGKDVLTEIEIETLPENGYLTFKGDTLDGPFSLSADQINRQLRFVPNKDWFGTTSFTYKVSDGTDWSNTSATVWITITPVNDAPVAQNDFYPIMEDEKLDSVNVLDNDTDVDDIRDSLRVSITNEGSAGEHGTIALDTHGNLTYQPKLNFNGAVSFTYTVCDTSDACATATVTIDVAPVNDPPIAKNDTITIFDDTKFYASADSTRLLFNDYDPEGDSIYLNQIAAGYPGDTIWGNSGKIVVHPNGDYIYFPDSATVVKLKENEVFIDSFQYVVADYPEGLPSSAQLLIRINGLNTPPSPKDDYVSVNENDILDYTPAFTLLLNDADPEGDLLTVVAVNDSVTGPLTSASGILNWKPDGEIYYQQGADNKLFDYLADGDTLRIQYTYTVSDGHSKKTERNARLNLLIIGKNDPPKAVNDAISLLETDDIFVSDSLTNLLVNDSDVDQGDSIFISKVNQSVADSMEGRYGTLHWKGDGSYYYTINHGATDSLYSGEPAEDLFPYTLRDKIGATSVSAGILTITIFGVDDLPNAVNDTLRMKEDDDSGMLTAGDNGLLDNDFDVDGDSLTVTSINDSSQKTVVTQYGTLTWDALGNIGFIIDREAADPLRVGEIALDSVRYFTKDPSGGESSAMLYLLIEGENDNPTAVNDDIFITEDTISVSGNRADNTSLLSNDSDIDGDSIFATQINGLTDKTVVGQYGELIWDSTGSYTYNVFREIADTLAQGEIAFDTFPYILSDIHSGTDTANLIIQITGVNDPPVAMPDSNSTLDIAPIIVRVSDTTNVLYNDFDIDGRQRKLTAINQSDNTMARGKFGMLSWNNDGGYIYKPDSAFAVSLRPLVQVTDTFTYRMRDEWFAADSTILQLTIVGINNPPIAKNDTLKIFEDELSKQLDPPGLLKPKNVQDPDKDVLKLLTMNASHSDSIAGRYGYIRWNSSGEVTYYNNPEVVNLLGHEQVVTEMFSYTVVDEGGLTSRANLVVKIIGENDSLIANRDVGETNEDSLLKYNVVRNDTDPDYNGLGNFDYSSLTIVKGPLHGQASRNSVTGEIYYFPDKDFYGNDSLIYQISDTGIPVYSDTAWFIIKVNPVNDPPVGTNLVLRTPMNTPVSFNYQDQVTDVDDGVDPNSLGLPSNNQLKKNGNQINYTPEPDFTGTDEFIYSMKDFSRAAAYVIVTVIVGNEQSTYSAADDYTSTWEETPVEIPILENDTIGGETPDPRTFQIKVFPQNGVATYNVTTQKIHYEPDKDFNGIDQLEYMVSSGPGNWSSAEVYINVSPLNDPMVANDDLAETITGQRVNIPILANDFDPENQIDTASFQLLLSPKHGSQNYFYSTGLLKYTPEDGFVGLDTLIYRICDLGAEKSCDSARVIVVVKTENVAFAAKNDTCSTNQNTPCTTAPLTNDDVSADPGSFSVLGGPDKGRETTNTNHTVTYLPEDNYHGPDWMQYIVSDSSGNWDAAEINVWVNQVNIPPVAVNDTAMVTQNSFKRLYVLENDYDTDGTLNQSTLAITGNGPKSGTVEIDNNTGTILYKPLVNEGTDNFTYTICDNQNSCTQASVHVTIELDTMIYVYRTTYEDTPDTIDLMSELARYNLSFPITSHSEELAPKRGSYSFINNNTNLVYTPGKDQNGNDVFWLDVCGSQCAYLRIYYKIIPVNDAPVAVDDTIHWDNAPGAKVINFDSLLVNDYDVDGDPIFLTDSVIQTGFNDLQVTFNSDSTITITANSIQWCSAWFTYEIRDAEYADTATVWIWPKLEGIKAKNDQSTVYENSTENRIDVLINDQFVDNQRCTIDTVIIITPPQHGAAIGTDDNFVNYKPARHYFGIDSLQYQIIDIWGQKSAAWLYLEVIERNTPPDAVDDNITATFGQVTDIPVLVNDFDPDAAGSDGDPTAHIDSALTRLSVGSYPLFGTVEFDPLTYHFIYTPDATSCEPDSFQYTIYDNEGGSDSAIVHITMEEAPLFANSDFKKTYPGVEVEIEPLQNDSGYFVPEETTHTIPMNIHGSVNWNSQNVVTYIPDRDFIGRDSIPYTIYSPCGNAKTTYIIFSVEQLRVPEIISPNNDTKNDVLIIEGIEYFPDNLLQIYNRYGHIVYEKKGYTNENGQGWGGYSNKGSLGGNKPLPAGTYYYTLIYNEGRNRQAGFVYLFW